MNRSLVGGGEGGKEEEKIGLWRSERKQGNAPVLVVVGGWKEEE